MRKLLDILRGALDNQDVNYTTNQVIFFSIKIENGEIERFEMTPTFTLRGFQVKCSVWGCSLHIYLENNDVLIY